jgi:predicted nucleic acid-binding protein
MSRWVIDASVVCKLLLPEPQADLATELLNSSRELFAPDFVRVETANVLWKWVRRGELEPLDAQVRLMQMESFPITLRSANTLLYPSMDIAVAADRTVYDSCYIALARALNVPCVTADRRLVNALASTEYAPLVVWLGNTK